MAKRRYGETMSENPDKTRGAYDDTLEYIRRIEARIEETQAELAEARGWLKHYERNTKQDKPHD